MSKASLIVGNSNWAIKDSSLLGYNINDSNIYSPFPFDVTRASAATTVNKAGLIVTDEEILSGDLVTNGDFATDSNWSKGVGWSISGGSANCNGTQTSQTNFFQVGIVPINVNYKVTFTTTVSAGGVILAIGGSNAQPVVTSSGTYTFTDKATSGDPNLYLSGNADFIGSIDNISVVKVNQNNLARIDYSDSTKGVLLTEPQSTNFLIESENFNNNIWNKQPNTTFTYNTTETISPDGTYNATKAIGNGTDGIYAQAAINGVVSRSIYIKSVVGNVNVILKDPALTVTQKSLSVTEDWQRFDLVEDNGHSTYSGLWVDNIPSSGVYIWGAQVEALPYATSYIPTYGSTVTRNQDLVTNGGEVSTFNSAEGTFFVEMAREEGDTAAGIISLNNGTAAQSIALYYFSTGTIAFDILNSSPNISGTSSPYNTYNFNKIALKYKSGDISLWVNGVEVITKNNTFSLLPLTNISFDYGSGANKFFGKVKQLQVFKTALTDSELIKLTTI